MSDEQNRKSPKELTDDELETLSAKSKRIIETLKAIKPEEMTPEEWAERDETLERASQVGTMLAGESIRRMMIKLSGRVAKLKGQADQARKDEGGPEDE